MQVKVRKPSKSNSIQWFAEPQDPRRGKAVLGTSCGACGWLPGATKHGTCNSCTFFPVKVKGCCKEYHFCIFFCIRLFWYLRYLFVSEWAISYHQLSISWFFHSFSPWSAARKAKAGGELLRQVLCGSKTSLLGVVINQGGCPDGRFPKQDGSEKYIYIYLMVIIMIIPYIHSYLYMSG